MQTCRACGERLPNGATQCPLCLVALPVGDEADVYELPPTPSTIPTEWTGGAVYTLELPAHCPHCRELIRSVRVYRLKRTQVTFTSPLPRGGRAIVCSACHTILSADVAVV
jgi:hypothetical protein